MSTITTQATHALPEELFFKLKYATGLIGTVTSDSEGNYRPYHSDKSIEDFFGELITNPYAVNESYYVLTNRKGKDSVKHAFAKYSNEYGSAFSSMCFFPELDEVALVLPVTAFDNLPDELWESTDNLPRNRYDKEGKVKEDTLVIYNEHGRLTTGDACSNPTFGSPVFGKTNKYINVTRLRQWISTKEGKAFKTEQLHAALKESQPKLLNIIQRGISIEDLISELKG